MMPFAFDLISTFVMGSTLPVATTDRVIVPASTVAIFAGSMPSEAPFSVENPQAAATTRVAAATQRPSFRDFRITSSWNTALPGPTWDLTTDRPKSCAPRGRGKNASSERA